MKLKPMWGCVLPMIFCAAIAALPRTAPAQDAAATAGSQFAAVLQPFLDSKALAGVVTLVADKDRVLSLEAIGYADIETHRLIQTDSLFWIASQSKPITATALMLLVDEGKVNVDDPVEKYLPEFRKQWLAAEHDDEHVLLKKPKHPILVRNILSHTSGLPFKSELEQPTLDLLPLRVAVGSHAMTPLLFEPDSKYQYANAGINTAGRIIEVVSGMPYEQFLSERLFQPLGMVDTTFWPNEEQLTRLAKSYKPNGAKDGLEETPIGQLKYPLNDPTRQPMPAGGLFSTAEDLAKFYQMLLAGGVVDGKRIISEKSLKQMTSRQTPESLKESYGFGFKTTPDTFGHGGAYGTNTTADRQRGLITIYLIQQAGFLGNGAKGGETFKAAALELFDKADQ